MKKIFTFITLAVLLTTEHVNANNIQLANVILNGQNTAGQYSIINFDVSWENSWRLVTNQLNYDGAWIFVKFRKVNGSAWQHATLNTTGNTTPAGSILKISADGKGAWIYHATVKADFAGNVNYTGAKIQWNYGADGVLNTDSVEIKVFALEMVYVPTGAYQLGSGGTETDHFFAPPSNNPYNVTSEAAITVGTAAGNLNYSHADAYGGDGLGPIPAAFPKGYNAFWIMKYECSMQQYVDFLNNLTLAQANNDGLSLFAGTHPNLITTVPELAFLYFTPSGTFAFADWAALRPFTELEFEKACRGTLPPVPNEYPWGNTTITPTTAVLNQNLPNETASNGNANYGRKLDYRTRTGIYATTDPRVTRTSSGGTYYGIMDMGGNLSEWCISAGATSGRSFSALNGDGQLDASGYANVSTWQLYPFPYIEKGGDFESDSTYLQVSIRMTNSNAEPGIRLARTAE